jgi:hypothetical protein
MSRKLRRNWKDNTKVDLREIAFDGWRWMEGLHCVQWLALILVKNLRVHCYLIGICFWKVAWFNFLIP